MILLLIVLSVAPVLNDRDKLDATIDHDDNKHSFICRVNGEDKLEEEGAGGFCFQSFRSVCRS